jgi:hypothetical protein
MECFTVGPVDSKRTLLKERRPEYLIEKLQMWCRLCRTSVPCSLSAFAGGDLFPFREVAEFLFHLTVDTNQQ